MYTNGRDGVEMIRSLNVSGKTYGYGFSTGPNSRTRTRTRGKTRGKPAGYPYPCSSLVVLTRLDLNDFVAAEKLLRAIGLQLK